MPLVALVLGLCGFLAGSVAFIRGWTESRDALLEHGATIAVAGLALVGVAAGISTWRQERARAREERQRSTYADLVLQLFARFGQGKFDEERELQLRAQVVTWGDPEIVRALNSWLRAFDEIVPPGASGSMALDEVQRKKMRTVTAQVVQAVRGEFRVRSGASETDIEGALFNHPEM